MTPDRSTLTGVGASAWASGSQEWKGARPALVPNPMTSRDTATRAVRLGISGATSRIRLMRSVSPPDSDPVAAPAE